MTWWGKLLGSAFGFMLGGPLGALLGVALGHGFDRGLARGEYLLPGDQERVQTAFFTATFAVMGAIAKADGRVSTDEIQLAERIMQQMRLDAAKRQAAIALFKQGKQADFPFDEVLEQFRQECHRRYTLLQMFIEIQLQAAYADGHIDAAEEALLLRICQRLHFSLGTFRQLELFIRLARGLDDGQPQQNSYQKRWGQAPTASTTDIYAVLGLKPNASEAEIKKAYRRLMSQHHPDKLVAKGLPEEMIEIAKQKTQQIRKAYELIKAQRRMN